MAGAANAVLASPVEMFKVRMQGQYGNPLDKRLHVMAMEMWAEWEFRKGITRDYWVRRPFLSSCLRWGKETETTFSMSQGYRGERDPGLCGVRGHDRLTRRLAVFIAKLGACRRFYTGTF